MEEKLPQQLHSSSPSTVLESKARCGRKRGAGGWWRQVVCLESVRRAAELTEEPLDYNLQPGKRRRRRGRGASKDRPVDEGGAPPLPQTKTLTESWREEPTSGPAVEPHDPATCRNGLQHVCGSETRGPVQGHVPGECPPHPHPATCLRKKVRLGLQLSKSSEVTVGVGGGGVDCLIREGFKSVGHWHGETGAAGMDSKN